MGKGVESLSKLIVSYVQLINAVGANSPNGLLLSTEITSMITGLPSSELMVMQANALRDASVGEQITLANMMTMSEDKAVVQDLIQKALHPDGRSHYKTMMKQTLLKMRAEYQQNPSADKRDAVNKLTTLENQDFLYNTMSGLVSPYRNSGMDAGRIYDTMVTQQKNFRAKTGYHNQKMVY